MIKLNLDLQKEKIIRGDLEKKLTGLEKKLNQLEKEIDARNRDRQLSGNKSNDSMKKSQSSIAETKSSWSKDEKGTESNSSAVSSASAARTELKTTRIAGNRAAKQLGQRPGGSAIGAHKINAKQVSNQPERKTSVSQSFPKSAATPKFQANVSRKNEIKSQAFELLSKTNLVVGPGLQNTAHSGPIDVIGAQSLPKEQQLIRSSVNGLLRLVAQQNNASVPAGQPAASLAANQPKTSADSPNGSLSDSSTNVNYSPSPSSNSSLEEV